MKPVPVIAAEFTVTGDVPVDVSVNDCVVAVFTVTLPKLRLPGLTANCGFAAAVPVPVVKVTICMTHAPELVSVEVAL